MKPYSNNVIFYDAEFSHLDLEIGELLSIGLVKLDGKTLYLEFKHNDDCHPWVKKHVLPNLNKRKISKEKGIEKIMKFFGHASIESEKPYLVSYVNQFDAIFWYKLFGGAKKHPAFWIPIDFASILFAHGKSPNSMGKKKFFEDLKINNAKYTKHNALDDAKLLREVYIKFIK